MWAKKKTAFFATLAVVLMVAGASYLLLVSGKTATVRECSHKSPLALKDTDDSHLQALAAYQEVCGTFVTDTLMVFTGFPGGGTEAETNAGEIAKKLKSFHSVGVKPIVIAEPHTGVGTVPYKDFLAGEYDTEIERFFTEIKARGVTDEMMGTWVPFPESNTPAWDSTGTTPEDFARCVNKYLGTMKRHFPQAKGSVLLDATTYDSSDKKWQNGMQSSLLPYIVSLDKSLVTSFGIQGFPWAAEATSATHEVLKTAEFLQLGLAVEAAEALHTQKIWINTGTFGSRHADDPAQTVRLSSEERAVILSAILDEAKGIQADHYVSINIFSEDKSRTAEATDWSYLDDADSAAAFKGFLMEANDAAVPVSLYGIVDKSRQSH